MHVIQHQPFITSFAKLAAITLLSSVLVGCNQANSEPTKDVIKSVKLFEVPVNAAQESSEFPGLAEAEQRAQLSFQVSGEVQSLMVNVGQKVGKGQVLAVLDDKDYRLAFDAKFAEYELAKSQFERAKQLYAKKLISTDQFDRNETSYKTATTNIEQAKTDLENTLITAPFDGVVSLRLVNQHQFVGANQTILNIQNVDSLDVAFNLPVTFVEKAGLKAIQVAPVWVVMDNFPNVPIHAELKELSTQPDLDTNTYSAKVTIHRPDDLNVLSGMAGKVHFAKPKSASTFTLPDGAWIEKRESTGTVWQFNPATSVIDALEVDLDENGSVTDGLPQGAVIVIAGAKDLYSGQQVREWTREGGI
ncbi:efflux RND transporter periplasmic adaptor subunit [Photobacterium sanguinicancri]|uniref:Efflux transporter periplasmic adaptor subunit n=1 Tax=Photobacterium sanguinicancri TaxID=875932 RepID=A0ABX4G0C7_9GAMM|nr:efflux RND transporter periplasmic adaptor subunit [Photobacterium sanguinicancri]MDO6499061.1 efflux RND transporter periplasmic adaptor subunit [Photobacterium sanguinicancri]OZS44583.1 efflux transporter periplasmic adaptor subunit [Photobacterium sanguinicancri]